MEQKELKKNGQTIIIETQDNDAEGKGYERMNTYFSELNSFGKETDNE